MNEVLFKDIGLLYKLQFIEVIIAILLMEVTMKNQIKCIDELQTKDYIIKKLKNEYKERVFVISTADIFKNKAQWADRVVKEIYNCNRCEMENDAYHFSYVKFALTEKNEVCGIVGGKSQFHWKYSSDVCFFDIEKFDNPKSRFMKKHNLQWYLEEIVILKNVNDLDVNEAYSNETYLQQVFSLFD